MRDLKKFVVNTCAFALTMASAMVPLEFWWIAEQLKPLPDTTPDESAGLATSAQREALEKYTIPPNPLRDALEQRLNTFGPFRH